MANLEKAKTSFVEHAVSIEGMLAQWKTYEELKKKLRGDGDFVKFQGRDGEMEAPTKKWRVKLERFFGISVEIIDVKETQMRNGEVVYTVKARASHPSGAYHEAMGVCTTEEKLHSRARRFHDALTHAETRAKNRAVFEFVGMGEVSKEELEEPDGITQKQKDYIKHLLTTKIHKDLSKAEEIIRLKIDEMDKETATRIIEKLKPVITLEQKEKLIALAKKVGFTNGDFVQFLKDNDVNPYAIPRAKYDYIKGLLEGMTE